MILELMSGLSLPFNIQTVTGDVNIEKGAEYVAD